MILLKDLKEKADIKKAFCLYKKAFPKEEQKPFKFLLKNSKNGPYELFTISDDEDSFYGIAFLVKKDNLVLLDFLAIAEDFRNQGLGSKTLKLFSSLSTSKLTSYFFSNKLIILPSPHDNTPSYISTTL